MAEGSDEVIDKVICGICSKSYQEPKLLPCFHSFCLHCLEDYVKKNLRNKEFACPLCDEKIQLPKDGAKCFESNVYLDGEMRSYEKCLCDLCESEVVAVNRCIDCDENYCKRCTEIHLKQKATRAHTVLQLNDPGNRGIILIKKRTYCENHPADELRVVCKDCDKMLCIVCKLTEHEKHNSNDIVDEAKHVREELKAMVETADQSLLKLEKHQGRIQTKKRDLFKMKETQLTRLRDYESRLKKSIERRIGELEMEVKQYFDGVCADISCFGVETEKRKASVKNTVVHVSRMIVSSDDVSLIRNSEAIRTGMTKRLTEAESRFPDKALSESEESWRNFRLDKIPMDQLFSIIFANEASVTVKIIGTCPGPSRYLSNNISSVSVSHKVCAVSFTDTNYVYITYSPGETVESLFNARRRILLTVDGDRYFYSDVENKEVKIWNKRTGSLTVKRSELHPHGIAFRLSETHQEELLVCYREDSDIMSITNSNGNVKVLPLNPEQKEYSFLGEIFPAPSRVAVNNINGFVCLSFPSIARISVHNENGTIISCFHGIDCKGNVLNFRPFGICFDKYNCIIVADRQGEQVARVTLFGKLIQVLVKGNKPTAVDVSSDDKLWVGYQDINLTVYQFEKN